MTLISMAPITTATAPWLALRAKADDDARSVALASRLVRLIPPGPVVVHDLGAGTGAMPRWLAPRLPGPQEWVLRDGDPLILEHVDLGVVADDAGRRITAGHVVEHLGDIAPDAFAGASAVTASALLDVVTAEEAGRVVGACVAARAPALFSLTVTGGALLHPPRSARCPDRGGVRRAPAARGAGAARPGRRPGRRRPVPRRALAGQARPHPVAPRPRRRGARPRVARRLGLGGGGAGSLARRPRRRVPGALVVVPHEDVLAWPG